MTIFQKMILVPVLSLLIYSGFIIYSFMEQQNTTKDIEKLRDDYMPVLQLVKNNILNFDALGSKLKDAVIAGERSWVLETLTIKQNIDGNLRLLEDYPHIISPEALESAKKDFDRYYKSAKKLADDIFKSDNSDWNTDEKTVQATAEYLTATNLHFLSMEQQVQRQFKQSIDNTYQGINQLLFWGGIISAFSMFFILLVTMMVSLSTRKNIQQLISRTKSYAQGEVNFARRIERSGQDELTELIYWFNKLSDKLEEDYKQLQAVSITDKLTGLNNRTRTDQYLPGVLQTAEDSHQPLFLAIMDIDHFKSINDNYGHLAGDNVLEQFAGILKSQATEHDFIGRWGGEEFIMIWPHVDRDEALDKANRLRISIANSHFSEVGKVTASIGLTESKPGDNTKTIVDRADQGLYKAKHLGRNRVHLAT